DISTPPAAPIGTNTVSAIKSGILFGYGGMVDGLIRRLREQMAPALPRTVATGGMATLIAPYTTSIDHVDPMLTLNGLRLLHERNA
ncbi:MAG: type III pantothenate kinase, partial [Desulfobulbaceae bacterium]|nr:type III pantothenate kinase [Desulfobulbaceae bacterium]